MCIGTGVHVDGLAPDPGLKTSVDLINGPGVKARTQAINQLALADQSTKDSLLANPTGSTAPVLPGPSASSGSFALQLSPKATGVGQLRLGP